MLLNKKVFTQNEFRATVKKLEHLKLWGFNGYEAAHFLYRTVLDYMLVGSRTHINMREFLRPEFYISTPKENAKKRVILYKSKKYGCRKDMLEAMDKVGQSSDDICIMEERKSSGLFWSLLIRIPLILQWISAFAKRGISGYLLFAFLVDTFRTQKYLLYLKQNEKLLKGADAFVVLNDEYCDENIFIQYGQNLGIPTATLQHGAYERTLQDNDIIHFSHVLENLTADRVFVWGDYYRRIAMECGIQNDRIVSTGIHKYIDVSIPNRQAKHRIIGLFLDVPATQRCMSSNLEMIRLCNIFAKEHNYKYLVKIHPGDTKQRYDEYYDKDVFQGVLDRDENVRDFVEKIDLAVGGMSSVFIEMLFFMVPVFRYYDQGYDIFERLDFGKFTIYEEWNTLFEEMNANPEQYQKQLKEMRDYCCGKGNTGDNYRRAINDLANSKS